MTAFPPLLRSVEDVLLHYPDKIFNYIATQCGFEAIEAYNGTGAKIQSPAEIRQFMKNIKLKGPKDIVILPENINMRVVKLDDDFFASSTLLYTSMEYISPWDIYTLDKLTSAYYASILWVIYNMV